MAPTLHTKIYFVYLKSKLMFIMALTISLNLEKDK